MSKLIGALTGSMKNVSHAAKLMGPLGDGGVSATAYGPLLSRWLMHKAGSRPDDACDRLLRALPTVPSRLLDAVYEQGVLAKRLSGMPLVGEAYPCPRPSTMRTFINHRTEFFDVALKAALPTVDQIVILGAGWDTRAYGLPQDAGVTVFEVDARGTQAVKREALGDAGIDVAGVVFVSADFNQEPWLDALNRHDFNPTLPTFFLWEGVTYYLDKPAIDATLAAVGQQCAPGSQIAFDYFDEQFSAGQGSFFARGAGMAVRAIGEPFTFGISTHTPAQQALEALLSPHGLSLSHSELLGTAPASTRPFGGLALAKNIR